MLNIECYDFIIDTPYEVIDLTFWCHVLSSLSYDGEMADAKADILPAYFVANGKIFISVQIVRCVPKVLFGILCFARAHSVFEMLLIFFSFSQQFLCLQHFVDHLLCLCVSEAKVSIICNIFALCIRM